MEFGLYCSDVITGASIGLWMHPLARQLVKALYNENILIDCIWFSVVSGSNCVTMRALVYEDENDNLEAVAKWEYNMAKVSRPMDGPWELVDIQIDKPVAGLV